MADLLTVRVVGRPAPEGSHEIGNGGTVRHSSKYLSAWRAAVNRDVRSAYLRAGLTRDDMPLIPNPRPVYLTIVHYVLDEQCRATGTDAPVGKPDADKLERATIDGLEMARAFANDSQVVWCVHGKERPPRDEPGGALIIISDSMPGWVSTNRENA